MIACVFHTTSRKEETMKKVSISTRFSNVIFIAGLWLSLVYPAASFLAARECDSTWQNSSASRSCGDAYSIYRFGDGVSIGPAFGSSYRPVNPTDVLEAIDDNAQG